MNGKARTPRLWPTRLGLAWLAAALVLGLGGLAGTLLARAQPITERFFREDLVAGAATAVFLTLAMLVRAPARRLPAPTPNQVVLAAAAGAAALALVGWCCVMRTYPLSMDEFMARFDATIFGDGRLFATISDEWRFARGPIQPQFMLFAPDGRSWASTYLPTNAMALALFGRLGDPALAGAVWAALAIVATYGVGRRLWPNRPGAAALAALLLATSTQLLLTAMTPYAMSAHLALNMVWLWLFLRGDTKGDLAALTTGFVACGLHQVIFHPLFVAPFILELWLARRGRRALVYTLGYAALGLFWLFYWKLTVPTGPTAAASGGALGLALWMDRLNVVMKNVKPSGLGVMAKNLFRFVTWQNPMLPALAVLGFVRALRAKAWLRPMALGVILMLVVVSAIMPYQGHGWGYRYLHGFLGVVSLIAAFAWMRLTDTMGPERRHAAGLAVALSAVFTLLVLLPLRAIQAERFVRPYERAEAAIRRTDAEVVVVDETGMMFAADLVRNDPFLRNRPKVLDLVILREPQIRTLCARHRVVVFDRGSGSALTPVRYPAATLKRLAENRALMRSLSCGTERIVMRR